MAESAAAAASGTGHKLLDNAGLEIKSFERRDRLRQYELEAQQVWADAKVFELDAGDPGQPKFLVTFPYPYMNGVLHVGHAFTLTKAEFAARFQRLSGKKVLFPFGFHCTGMPISAAAQKIKREIELYGNPPKFPEEEKKEENEQEQENEAPAAEKGKGKKDTGAPKKKGKVEKKKSAKKYQWQILEEMGVPSDRVAEFADPLVWLKHFPPIGMEHLKEFGLHVDWRRSFITTSLNPYYDAFIRWQFNTLKKLNLIDFGKRVSVFSLASNQSCADHDRESGEGVGPQEYTGIKMKLFEPYPKSLEHLAGKNIYLIAATLRPETMYGQTNCWILPRGEYGAYEMNNGEIFVMSARAALNMSCQDLSPEFGKPKQVAKVEGWDLLGKAVKGPNNPLPKIYVLPLLTVSMDKGTGVVTSVPSDAPDDYAALRDLQNDAEMRKKYYVTEEMVNVALIPIIDIPELGNLAAKKACEDLEVKTQHDRVKLDQAKELTYKLGFARGKMLVGPYAGQAVSVVKPIIQKEMVERKDAILYSEPENKVVARTGDECVCALTDQWYMKYGADEWKAQVQKHVENNLETYNPLAKQKFLDTIAWLREWACSRTFGLGTNLPWDPQFVIESLSDSTIYMSYYTIAHLLQQGSLEGSVVGPAGIKASQLTDEVFNFIFLDGPAAPAQATGVSLDILNRLRKEFSYWYPVDLRVSGKDLIGNHLTMSLYNHAAIWSGDQSKWPQSFFTNGHSLLNDDKMSKSTGNFMTLHEAIELFGADATRFALADAGDGLEDANFTVKTANAAILRLTKEDEWMNEVIAAIDTLRTGPADSLLDQIFANDINKAITLTKSAYSSMQFRAGLKVAVFDFQNDRNYYRASLSNGMHRDLVVRFMEVFILLISPICPHWAEKKWKDLQKAGLVKSGLVVNQPWPQAGDYDANLALKSDYLKDFSRDLRLGFDARPTVKKGKKPSQEDLKVPNALYLYVAREYPPWQKAVLVSMQGFYDEHKQLPGKEELSKALKQVPEIDKKMFGPAMAFGAGREKEFAERGVRVLQTALPFDELAVVKQNIDIITRGLELTKIEIYASDDNSAPDPGKKKASAVPGSPSFSFRAE